MCARILFFLLTHMILSYVIFLTLRVRSVWSYEPYVIKNIKTPRTKYDRIHIFLNNKRFNSTNAVSLPSIIDNRYQTHPLYNLLICFAISTSIFCCILINCNFCFINFCNFGLYFAGSKLK